MLPRIDEVHVSVAFTYDLPEAERLAEVWQKTGIPVKLGGPAMNEPGCDFVPGRYVRPGYVITSRGCNNRCWFCAVPKREGFRLRELPISEGSIILDDNLLACSETHIRAVFAMLKNQPERPIFTGGLEAKLLRPWHVEILRDVKTKRFYCAYDTPDDYEPLVAAGKLPTAGGVTRESRKPKCYVLVGYPRDRLHKAETVPFTHLAQPTEGEVATSQVSVTSDNT